MITLKKPENLEIVPLLTDYQKRFLNSDRSTITPEDYDILNLEPRGTNNSTPRGVLFVWEADNEGEVQISENENFDDYRAEKGNGECTVYNLKIATKYFWRVVTEGEISEVSSFITEDICPRFIKVDGIMNVRDLGGWKSIYGKKVKQGLLYRGTEMNSHLTIEEEGLKTMREVLKINTVLDIRCEREEVKDIYQGNYVNIPARAYDWLDHRETAKEIFDFLCNPDNYPVYFHCYGGADRTAVIAFMIGAVLGMTYDNLVDDYELTSMARWGVRTKNSDKYKRFINQFNELEGETHYEKAVNYLLDVGVTMEQLETLRSFMLEK